MKANISIKMKISTNMNIDLAWRRNLFGMGHGLANGIEVALEVTLARVLHKLLHRHL